MGTTSNDLIKHCLLSKLSYLSYLMQVFGNWSYGTIVFTVLVFTVTLKVQLIFGAAIRHTLLKFAAHRMLNLAKCVGYLMYLVISLCHTSLLWTRDTGHGSTTL